MSMRAWLLLMFVIVSVSLLGCSPSEAGSGLLAKSGLDSAATGRVVDTAFESEKSCSDDMQCGVGRICVNSTCQPKPPSR